MAWWPVAGGGTKGEFPEVLCGRLAGGRVKCWSREELAELYNTAVDSLEGPFLGYGGLGAFDGFN